MAKVKNRKKRLIIVLCSVLFFVVSVLGVLELGCIYTAHSWTHFYPDYPKVDIMPTLQKAELTEADYELLYRQTGLTKLGIDGLLEKEDFTTILDIQEFFFKKQEVIVNRFNPFTYDEKIKDIAPMARLEDGDILVTATTRVSWFRYGHAALVVDGEAETVVESISPGSLSTYNDASDFSKLANFMILRPKADAETKAQVVEYAKNNLVGLPYRFTVGIFFPKFPETLKKTQCAHLVWYAYKKFGIDLDSDGKGIVKPPDMARSEHVEVVQAYGFDLDALWSKS